MVGKLRVGLLAALAALALLVWLRVHTLPLPEHADEHPSLRVAVSPSIRGVRGSLDEIDGITNQIKAIKQRTLLGVDFVDSVSDQAGQPPQVDAVAPAQSDIQISSIVPQSTQPSEANTPTLASSNEFDGGDVMEHIGFSAEHLEKVLEHETERGPDPQPDPQPSATALLGSSTTIPPVHMNATTEPLAVPSAPPMSLPMLQRVEVHPEPSGMAYQTLLAKYFPEVAIKLDQAYESATIFQSSELIERFHSLLRTGVDLQEKPTGFSRSAMSSPPSLLSRVKDIAAASKIGLFVEYSSQQHCASVSRFLSAQPSAPAAVLFQLPPVAAHSRSQPEQECAVDMQAVVAITTSVATDALVAIPTRHCIQYVEDLGPWATELLPFEFEAVVGRLLSQCAVTLMPRSLPSSPFFVAWESMSALVRRAFQRAREGAAMQEGEPGAAPPVSALGVNNYTTETVYGSYIQITTNVSTSAAMTWRDLRGLATNLRVSSHSRLYLMKLLHRYAHVPAQTGGRSWASLQWAGGELRRGANSTESTASPSSAPSQSPTTAPVPLFTWPRVVSSTSSATLSSQSFAAPASNASITDDFPMATPTSSTGRRLLASGDLLGPGPLTGSSVRRNESVATLAEDEILEVCRAFAREHPPRADSVSPSDRYQLQPGTRALQRSISQREAHVYQSWMAYLSAPQPRHYLGATRAESPRRRTIAQSLLRARSIFVVGGHASLLSLKLAKMVSSAKAKPWVVSVLLDDSAADAHWKLAQMMRIENNLITTPAASVMGISNLAHLPERADVLLAQSDLLLHLLAALYQFRGPEPVAPGQDDDTLPAGAGLAQAQQCNVALLLDAVGVYLAMGTTSYVELPGMALFAETVAMMVPGDCQAPLLELYADPLAFLEQALRHSAAVAIATVQHVRSSETAALFSIHRHDARTNVSTPAAPPSMSLRTLRALNLIAAQRKTLFQLLTTLPMWSYASAHGETAAPILSEHVHLTLQAGTWSLQLREDELAAEPAMVQDDPLLSAFLVDKQLYEVVEAEFGSHPNELAGGRFSFVDHDSGRGFFSTMLAAAHPNATVLSIERDADQAAMHLRLAEHLRTDNNALCRTDKSSSDLSQHFYASPELFRYQLLYRAALMQFAESEDVVTWGHSLSNILSSALTSFVFVPNKALVSWAAFLLYGQVTVPGADGALRQLHLPLLLPEPAALLASPVGAAASAELRHNMSLVDELEQLANHPQRAYAQFDQQWLFDHTVFAPTATSSQTALLLTSLTAPSYIHRAPRTAAALPYAFLFPLVRCDVVNMTRHVKHHFQSDLDGHTRTYTMHIGVNLTATREAYAVLGRDPSAAVYSLTALQQVRIGAESSVLAPNASAGQSLLLPLGNHVNQHSVVAVHLHRDRDDFPIPYTTIYGITLISALRLGLQERLRDRLFKDFLKMPLFEDMAPWNLVLMGSRLEYIDYDTRDITFDADVPKAYQIMSVLMNYKRTVQDFARCGSPVGTVYGLPFISDCVGRGVSGGATGSPRVSCPDLRYAVPCGDGVCHSDYISCLRSLSNIAEGLDSAAAAPSSRYTHHDAEVYDAQVVRSLAQAMRSVVSSFNSTGGEVVPYAAFLRALERQ